MSRGPSRPRSPYAFAQRRTRFLSLGTVTGGVIVAALCLAVVGASVFTASSHTHDEPATNPRAASGPPGTVTYRITSRHHVAGHVRYAQSPPVGGDHSALHQNCGFYSHAIDEPERGVHSLEHGAVWITFDPDLPDGEVQLLHDLAQRAHVLVSPWPGLDSPVVASAWGRQLRLDTGTDHRLQEFVQTFRGGAQAPERGGPCSGGVGIPG